MIMKYVLLFLLFIYSCEPTTSSEIKDFDFPEIDSLKLFGVITEINSLEKVSVHGYGIISLKVFDSNVKFYNPKEKHKRYFLVIKDDKADLFAYVGTKKAGDTIKIDMTAEKEFWYKNSETGQILNYSPRIYERSLYDYIERNNLSKILD